MTTKNWQRVLGSLITLALLLGACGSSEAEATSNPPISAQEQEDLDDDDEDIDDEDLADEDLEDEDSDEDVEDSDPNEGDAGEEAGAPTGPTIAAASGLGAESTWQPWERDHHRRRLRRHLRVRPRIAVRKRW